MEEEQQSYTKRLTGRLAWIDVYVFAVCNVALNRPSFQSSVYQNHQESYRAQFGNDGMWTNLNGQYSDPNCVHSELETNPWWAVDLGVSMSVQEILFTNRVNEVVGEHRKFLCTLYCLETNSIWN